MGLTGEDALIKDLDEIMESISGSLRGILKCKSETIELKKRDLSHVAPLLLEVLDESLELNTELSEIFIKFAKTIKRYLEENKSTTTLITT